jgi:hypothetical protein
VGDDLACHLEIDPMLNRDKPKQPIPPSSYHVLDSNLVTISNGSIHEVPKAWAYDGHDGVRIRNTGIATLRGRVILDDEQPTETREEKAAAANKRLPARLAAKRIVVSYRGVAKVSDSEIFFSQRSKADSDDQSGREFTRIGTAFTALQFESSHPLYRWLIVTQFVGFGEIHLQNDEPSHGRPRQVTSRRLRFSYDIYSAG